MNDLAAIPEVGLYYYKARFYNPKLGRFMQTDPIGYDDDLNLYSYVGGDPGNRTDPTGLYDCDGSENACKSIARFVAAISKAAERLPDSDYKRDLKAVAAVLGKENDDNGFTISAASLGKNVMAHADSATKVSVDVGKAGNWAKWADSNIPLSPQSIADARGGGAVAHEVQHSIDMGVSGRAATRDQEYATELNAYRTESGVYEGLQVNGSMWGFGMQPSQREQAIRHGAQVSTAYWCQANAAAGIRVPGC